MGARPEAAGKRVQKPNAKGEDGTSHHRRVLRDARQGVRRLQPAATQGDVPGSDGRKWGKDARKPPHFHIPFRAYPFEGGEPRGREKGLDTFYEVDAVSASPSALHATLAVNMKRTPLTYAPVFKSRLPRARGRRAPARQTTSAPAVTKSRTGTTQMRGLRST